MKNKSKKKIRLESFLDNKYQSLYMSLGLSLGLCLGMAFGLLVMDNLSVGMCMGMAIGMGCGISVGAARDRRIAEQAQVIVEIIEEDFGCEGVPEDAEVTVTLVLLDVGGTQSHHKIPDRLAIEKDLRVGDRIYIFPDGTIEKYKRSENK